MLMVTLYMVISVNVKSQSFTESFDDVSTLTAKGWVLKNNSDPIGIGGWEQGAPHLFSAYNGNTNSYISSTNEVVAGSGTISNWLISPNRTFKNGDEFFFYTRATDDFPDRLQVWLSTNGESTTVGTDATSTGDFTTLLLDINPTLVVEVYPTNWTRYTITISDLPTPTSGRIAFRYFVTDGGPDGENSDYIGIDEVVYAAYECPVSNPFVLPNGIAGVEYSEILNLVELFPSKYIVTGGSLPEGLEMTTNGIIIGTPTEDGLFYFTVDTINAIDCSNAKHYELTIECPANEATFTISPAQTCSNITTVTIEGGLPLGGTYSGTGMSESNFDPSYGSQTITYTLTDIYGCTQTAQDMIIVNTPPEVSLPDFTDLVYANSGVITLTDGTPMGGTFSGAGVTDNTFDTSIGQGLYPITYTFTDLNECVNSATKNIEVLLNTNVKNLSEIQDVNIYPNPSKGEFTVNYTQTTIGNLTVKIINLQGQVIITDEMINFSGLFSKKYDLRLFENGLYMLQLINDDNQATYKIIIQ